jgi:hypothetical protein
MPLSDQANAEGDFDALFGADERAGAVSSASPGRKAAAVTAVHTQPSTSAHRHQQQQQHQQQHQQQQHHNQHQQDSSDRSLSAKRSVTLQRPSSSKPSSAKPAANTNRSARPASAPASVRLAAAAAASDDLGLDASSSVPAEPPVSASQVTLICHCLWSANPKPLVSHVGRPLSSLRRVCAC